LPLAGFQKWWALYCPLFKRELFISNLFLDFKTSKIAPCRFSKALGATPRHLSANRSKEFELTSFENFQDICQPIGVKNLNSPVLKSFQQIQNFWR
jgi:hypothetical protein